MTDQHRLSAVGAYGPTPCRTPNIDRLAAEGVLFENAYTTCPVCSPARGSVITGLFPHAHGMTSNIHDQCCAIHEIEDRPGLLSRRMEAAGYRLGYSGKWHLGSDQATTFGGSNRPSLPRDVGFEGQNFSGHGNGGHTYQEYRDYLSRIGLRHVVVPWSHDTDHLWFMNTVEGPTEATIPYFLAEHTISLIDKYSGCDSPFFIWHNFWGPHAPFYVPSSYLTPYLDTEIPEWPNYRWPSRTTPGPHHIAIHPDHERLTWDDWATAIRYYYAYTTLIDEQIGRIVEHLRSAGALENTVIVFAADHGQTLGSHGGLTDKGWHHFEEIQRIPFIVRSPAPAEPGAHVHDLVSLADLYPTILDLAGNGASEDDSESLHGESLAPLIERGAATATDHRGPFGNRGMVVTEFNGLNGIALSLRSVRWSHWKFGFSAGSDDQLYDLASDPYEVQNLASDPGYRPLLREGRQRLVDWMNRSGDRMSWWYRRMNGMDA